MKDIPKVAGIVWYKSKEDFLKARAIFTDAFLLPDTYEDFLVGFSEAEKAAYAKGFDMIVKAEFNPGTFAAWCKERSLNIDTHGREAFAHNAAIEFLKQSGKL